MSISPETLQKIRDQLQTAKHVGGAVPSDLYAHLTEVFNRIMLHHPTDSYEKFEEISTLVKHTHLSFADPKHDFEINAAQSKTSDEAKARDAWIQKSKNLLAEVNDMVSREDRRYLDKSKKFVIPNFDEEAEMLEWAGVCFGEEDTYRLGKAIKRLAVMSGSDRVRFVAKVYGTCKDYWVCSGVLPGDDEMDMPREQEKRGKGTNTLVYWVTDDLLSDWIQLPDAQPTYICASRMIKHVMTGDLNASIDSNPPFPGKERHFLRAQLARIFHASAIVPKGLFEMDEESGEMKFSEEFAIAGTDDLKNLESWVNLHPGLLKAGRCTHLEPIDMEEDAKAAFIEAQEVEDKVEDRFKEISAHMPMPGAAEGVAPWSSKICGDTQQYNVLPPKEGTTSYAVNVIRSLKWPGAMTVSKGGKFTNIYIGNGMKRGDASMNPIEPPEVQADPSEPKENLEPTPFNKPEEVVKDAGDAGDAGSDKE